MAEWAWTFTKWAISGLGRFAGISKIYDLLFSRPKIIGELEQKIHGEWKNADNSFGGAFFVLQLCLVNARVKPTTIRGFKVEVLLFSSGKWLEGQQMVIPDGFSIPGYQIDFKNVKLNDKVASEYLQYGKVVRGWIMVLFPGIQKKDIVESDLRIELTDALKNKHHIKHKYKPGANVLTYFPNAGIKT
jgi:hypothetical protein